MYKPYHLIGLELGISVASAGLRGEARGSHGRLMPAAESLARGALPIGLAHDVVLQRPVGESEGVRWSDVAIDENAEAVQIRRDMGAIFRQE
jgi:predicted homoserine dehydrogenase-like protein